MIDTDSPTVWRRWLAREMTARRDAKQLSQREVADRLRCLVGKVSNAETGERCFRPRDLTEILLPLYDVPEDEWPRYLDACERSKGRGWWDEYDEDIVPRWYAYYLGLEQGAVTLSGFTMQVVPGLLQTRAYARTIMGGEASGLIEEDAAGRLDVRLRRQHLLEREPQPLVVHYVLDEAVLRRLVGGPDVMAEQLAHLVELAERDNVTIQVLPFTRGYYYDGQGEPVLLRFPWPDDPGVAYIEGRTSGETIESEHVIADIDRAFEHVRRVALPELESVTMIKTIAEGMS